MDPLALLSDDESSAGEEPGAATAECADDASEPASASSKRKFGSIGFDDLKLAGYKPTDLLTSTSYLNDAAGQEDRKPKRHDPPAEDAVKEKEEEVAQHSDKMESSVSGPAPDKNPLVQIFQTNGASRPVPAPWETFDSAGQERFPASLCEVLALEGFQKTTPIQAHAFPILAQGRDVVGIAQTGSGKTFAYLLPCLARVLRPTVGVGAVGFPSVLVLGPTRELVCQIEKEVERFQKSSNLKVTAVYGGAPKAPQLAGLRSRPQLVVATPGRLTDLLSTAGASCTVAHVNFLVLDEADRMLDEGFEPQIREIVDQMRSRSRQTMLFSATWPMRVQTLAEDFLKDPVEIRVGKVGALQANPDVAQDIMLVREPQEKSEALVSLLNGRPKARALVFVSTKRTCRELQRCLCGRIRGQCDSIHGDRSQREREQTLQAFRDSDVRVLFATDVASRGLDVPGVTLVVNYDPPRDAEDYVHRIGRTGRAGQSGVAVSILTAYDTVAMEFIVSVMKRTGVRVPPAVANHLGGQSVLPGGTNLAPAPQMPWRDSWEGLEAKRYKPKDLSSAVSELWS